MSVPYKNPTSNTILTGVSSVLPSNTFGTNFSVFNVGGYMEVYSLQDLEYSTFGATGNIQNSGNTIPIQFYKRPSAALSDYVTLYNDGISSGRRRLGMLVFVQETQQTYQYTIDNYDALWDAAVINGCVTTGSTSYTVRNRVSGTERPAGQALIAAWTGSTIEGVSGVTASTARWKIFWGTDWQVTGGTITYNSTGDLALESNSGNTVTISGFKTITGGTYNSETSTLTLTNNLAEDISVTGFTSGSSGSSGTSGTSGRKWSPALLPSQYGPVQITAMYCRY